MAIKNFCALDVQFVITGANRHQNVAYYYHYIDHLWKVMLLIKSYIYVTSQLSFNWRKNDCQLIYYCRLDKKLCVLDLAAQWIGGPFCPRF